MTTEFKIGEIRRFSYAFIKDPNTSMPELAARHGRSVVVLRQLNPNETGDPSLERMFKVTDPIDGFSWDVFESEIDHDYPTAP